MSFRRFVLAFYTREFREIFFTEVPNPRMFQAVVTILAGYWNPSLRTRAWVAAFFLMVRLQRYLPIAPRLMTEPPRPRAREAAAG